MQKDMLLRSNSARFDACGIAQATRDRSRDALSFSSAFIVADARTHSPIVRSLRWMAQTRPHVSRFPGVAICAMHRRDDRVTVRRAAVRRRDHVDGIAVGQGMHGHLHSARSKKRIRKSKAKAMGGHWLIYLRAGTSGPLRRPASTTQGGLSGKD
jgi:hypothetical protein